MKVRGFRFLLVCLIWYTTGGLLPGQENRGEPEVNKTKSLTRQTRLTGETAPSPYRQAPGEILVRFRDSTALSRRQAIHAGHGGRVLREFHRVRGLQLVKLPTGVEVSTALKNLRKHPEVLYAEPNYVIQAMRTPDDPQYDMQWGLHNDGASAGSVAGADIDAPAAWELTTGGRDAVLAVIDTGIDYTHPDLAANVFRNEADCDNDGVDDDGNSFADDCHGIDTVNLDSDPLDDNEHGTHVSGIIGAVGNNHIGVTGVSWSASILPCKFLDADGYGTTEGAIACLEYIADMKDRGVNIVASNNSWGGGPYSQALYDAIEEQRQRGILFVTAAGNYFLDNDTLQSYPCSYHLPNIICVASTTAADNLYYSNYGKRIVHIGAPGDAIYSTIPQSMGSYASLGGTSMATAFVTGTAGLVYAYDSTANWLTVRNHILVGADPNPNLDQILTGRRLNARGAISCAGAPIMGRQRPLGGDIMAAVGTKIELSALHIDCAGPAGEVPVTIQPGNATLTLRDDGTGDDPFAGDGIYSGSWTPSSSGSFTLTFPENDTITVTVDPDLQAGFPVKAWHASGYYAIEGPVLHTLVSDIDGDGSLDIMTSTADMGPISAWDHRGRQMPGWPQAIDSFAYPAAGELDKNTAGNEIFMGLDLGYLLATAGDGTWLPGWPLLAYNYLVMAPPALFDIDGDGVDEIFIGEGDGRLHGYKANGRSLAGWPTERSAGTTLFYTPAIADLDSDGDNEIIAVTQWTTTWDFYGAQLYAFHHNGKVVEGFPVLLESAFTAYPTVGDVDGDGRPEIVLADTANVLIFDGSGQLRRTLPLEGSVYLGTVPALADLDGDTVPEIIVQTDEALNVFSGGGATRSGWPVRWGNDFAQGGSSPVVGDVNGDSLPDIVLTSASATATTSGLLRAYDRDGTPLPGFPKTLPLGLGAVPAIADIDNDGRNEIIVTGGTLTDYPGYYDSVWVYDLGGQEHGPALWGQFMGNAAHTGTVKASYTAIDGQRLLSISVIGKGRITSDVGGLTCSGNCSHYFATDTTVTLLAVADSGYLFSGWNGACSGAQKSCTLTLDANRTVTAIFKQNATSSATNSSHGSDGRCFIATAAYGSYLADDVVLLRAFRDRYLLTNAAGRSFVNWYYRISPPIAAHIARHTSLRAATRAALLPLVVTIKHPQTAALLITLIGIGLGVWFQRQKTRSDVILRLNL